MGAAHGSRDDTAHNIHFDVAAGKSNDTASVFCMQQVPTLYDKPIGLLRFGAIITLEIASVDCRLCR